MQRRISFAAAVLALPALWIVGSALFWDRQAKRVDAELVPHAVELTVPNPGRRLWLDGDCAYWMIHVRDLLETGRWRIRHTSADNAPHGRPMHWSHPVMWLLIIGGRIRSLLTGQPLFAAVEDAAVWLNPIIMLGWMLLLYLVLHKQLDPWGMVLLTGIMVTHPDLEWAFQPLRPDHQGLQILTVVGTFCCLWAAQTAPVRGSGSSAGVGGYQPVRPRGLWLLAGVLTGCALWLGATVAWLAFIPMLVAWAGWIMLVGAPSPDAARGWSVWAIASALTALCAWAIEYMPSSTRLTPEVNHPLYAICLLILGATVSHIAAMREKPGGARRRWLHLLALLAAASGPLLLWLNPSVSHALRDPFMRRYHAGLSEFESLFTVIRQDSVWNVARRFGLIPVAVIWPAASSLWSPRAPQAAPRALAAMGALGLAALALYQVRWLPFFIAASSLCAAIWMTDLQAGPPCAQANRGWRPPSGLLAWLLLLHPLLFAEPTLVRMIRLAQGDSIRPKLLQAALNKRLATRLRAAMAEPEPVFMAEPDLAPALYYHARIRSVASNYWENREGLEAWARFFADVEGSTAKHIATDRGITHVLVSRGPRHAYIVWRATVGFIEPTSVERLLAARLSGSGSIPQWLRPDVQLTAIGSASYRLGFARRLPKQWETRFLVYTLTSDRP